MKKINEAQNDNSGGKRELIYDVGFKNSKNLKGEFIKTTFLNIGGLTNIDKTTLTSPQFKAIAKKDGSGVFYTMTNDDSFLNSTYFSKMYNYLSGTGNYIMPDINIMKAEISQGKLDNIDWAKKKEQDNKFEDMFEKIMKSLNDPKTKELLKKISSIGFDINERVYGKVRSAGNVIRTFAVKPDATFVATRKNYKKLYNRILKSNPTPIYLSVPNATSIDRKKAETELGVKYNDIKDNPHKLDSFKISSTAGIDGFSTVAFFDVSDTILIPGYPDTFNNNSGLVDNLRGELNQMAKEELGKNKINTDELDIKTDDDNNSIFFNRFIKFLTTNQQILPSNEVKRLSSLNPQKDSTVVEILKTYFSNVSFAREHDNAVKSAKVYAAMAATLTVEDLAEVERLRIIKMHENNIGNILTKKQDFVSIALPVTNICNILKPINENMNEDKITVTPEYIMDLFNIEPESLEDNVNENLEIKNQIKENFFNVLNKLYKTK